MTPSHPTSPEAIFSRLRAQLFGGHLAARTALAAGEAPTPDDEVIGVVVEIGTHARTLLVFGLCDGTASLHWSTGGGLIGGPDRPLVSAAAKRLVELAGPVLAELPRVVDHPLPAPGRVRVSILTAAGVHAGEDGETSLMNGRGLLFPLFVASNEILKGFRQMPPSALS